MRGRSFMLGMGILVSSMVAQAQMQIYGSWHCGNDFCTWASVRNMTDFDTKNHWIIDRGDGSGKPSVNLVILSFVQPMKLLNKTNDAGDVNGVPVGMNSAVVQYFTSHKRACHALDRRDHIHELLGPGAVEQCNAVGVECGGARSESGGWDRD